MKRVKPAHTGRNSKPLYACLPTQTELEEEMRRHGFVKLTGPGMSTRAW